MPNLYAGASMAKLNGVRPHLRSYSKRSFSLLLFVSFFAFSNWALAKFPELKPGLCYTDPESKVYLSNLRESSSANLNRIRSEIGIEKLQSLNDTEGLKYYFCRATCQDQNGIEETLWITQSNSPTLAPDMNEFLCYGVQIESAHIVGSLFGPKPVSYSFPAYQTNISEIHAWLKDRQFAISSFDFAIQFSEFQKEVYKSSQSYSQSNSLVLLEAANILSQIANLTPHGEKYLRQTVLRLAKDNWQIRPDANNPNFYVEIIIKQIGRFLEYSEFFESKSKTISNLPF